MMRRTRKMTCVFGCLALGIACADDNHSATPSATTKSDVITEAALALASPNDSGDIDADFGLADEDWDSSVAESDVLPESTNRDRPPRITTLQVAEASDGAEGWRVDVKAVDPDGDSVDFKFRWFVNNKASGQTSDQFQPHDLTRGDEVYVEVVAHDGFSESRPLRSGVITIANAAPEITSAPNGLSNLGTFSYQIETTDADGDTGLEHKIIKAPPGMELSRSGEFAWTPTVHQAGDHTVIFTVSDGRGGVATQEFVLPVRHSAKHAETDTVPASAE